ncbi:hypothetical protein [Bartonella sp. CB175]|uniref:hypothetical protein n=1 Tax=Bartonella sp. CB175 TaxID=3112256 RepID=UPI00300DC4B6
MNTKSHINKQIMHEKSSSFSVEQRKATSEPTEMTMSDIATKLRYVSAHMKRKHQFHPSMLQPISQNSVKDDLKSYLDDISRAILADHYARRQKEKKFFESLEQIKILIQNLHSEEKNQQESLIKRSVPCSKPLDSIVHHLAHMTHEKSQEGFLPPKMSNSLTQNNVNSIPTSSLSSSPKREKNSFPKDAVAAELVETEYNEPIERSIREKNYSGVQESDSCIKNNHASFFKAHFSKILFFLRYSVKKWLIYFLSIAFIIAITLCFCGF